MLLHHLLLSWHWIWINFARCEMSHFVEDCHGSARRDWDFLWYVCLFHHLLRRFESFINSALALRGELLRCLIEVFFLLLIFCRNHSIICNFNSFLLLGKVCRWWDRKLVWKEAEQIARLQSIIFWVHKIGQNRIDLYWLGRCFYSFSQRAALLDILFVNWSISIYFWSIGSFDGLVLIQCFLTWWEATLIFHLNFAR